MRALAITALFACSSSAPPQPQPRVEPQGSATTTSAATLTPGVELPEVALQGFDAADKVAPAVSVTLSGLTVDGKVVAAMTDGVLLPDELDGAGLGMKIVKLAAIADQLAKAKRIDLAFDKRIPYRTLVATIYTLKQSGHKQFGLLARAGAEVVLAPITLPDHSAPRRRPGADLGAQIDAAKNATSPKSILTVIQTKYLAGIKRCYKDHLKREPSAQGKLALTFTVDKTGRTKQAKAVGIAPTLDTCVTKLMASWRFPPATDPEGEMFAINIALVPDGDPTPEAQATPAADQLTAPQASPLQLIVSVSKTEVILWSISALEGTLKAPKLTVKLAEKSAMTDLNRALAEIVANRFPTKREPDDRAIIIQADAATPVQTIADVIGAVRATPDGKELFPDIGFAEGFE